MLLKLDRAIAMAALLFASSAALANHPVLVEGNCDSPVPGTTLVAPGTCGDFDGDGRISLAEDEDGDDRIFGTITAALGPGLNAAAGTGIDQNGTITIVTSGRFAEALVITAANGNVTLQAAPGVEAQIDAVLQGDPAGGNATRQANIGIIVGTPGQHSVTLRNLTIQNWAIGIDVAHAQVALINVRLVNNVHFGVRVRNAAEVSISQSQVIATGFRVGAGAGSFPTPNTPFPGAGIAFLNTSKGAVFRTEVSGSFGPGIRDQSTGIVTVLDAYLFNNNPNTVGVP